jgi:hypothetical protein
MRIILVILCYLVKQAPGIETEDYYYSGEDYSELLDTQYIPGIKFAQCFLHDLSIPSLSV